MKSRSVQLERLLGHHTYPKSNHVEKLLGKDYSHNGKKPVDILLKKANGGSTNIEPEYKKGGCIKKK